MGDEFYDFGHASLLDAEAIGEPGARRFRIFARSPRGSASLWVERDQLDRLGALIEKILAKGDEQPNKNALGLTLRPEAQAKLIPPPGAPADFPHDPEVEFLVGPMQLGASDDGHELLLRATPIEVIESEGELFAREGDTPRFAVIFNRRQARILCASINTLLLMGRPRCPFCNSQMGPGHICPKQNGYHPVGLN
jgi:uncharacterized repeat protein (TIGR03847 family)